MSSSSSHIFYLVTKTILPKLDVLAQTVELPSEKKSLLTVYNNILQARLDLEDPQLQLAPADGERPDVATTDAFLKFRQSIVDIYFGAMSKVEDGSGTDTVFGTAAMEGLVLLTKIPEFLSPVEKAMVLEKIDGVLLSSNREQESHGAALRAIEDMSNRDPTIFKDITLPNFMKLFPEKLSTEKEKQSSQVTGIVNLLQDLILVSCSSVSGSNGTPAPGFRQHNFDACMESLLQLWQNLVGQAGQLQYANAILAAIFRGLELFDSAINSPGLPADDNLGFGRYLYVVLLLFSHAVEIKHDTKGDLHYIGLKESQSLDEISIHLIGKIATLALRSESAHLRGEDNFLLAWNQQYDRSAIWCLFFPSAEAATLSQEDLRHGPEDKCLVNFLSVSLLAGIQPKVNIPLPSII
jgi:DNA repair/transcription protein MET18/MMS19